MEYAHLVVQFLIAIDANGDADRMFGHEVHDLFRKQGCIGGEAGRSPRQLFMSTMFQSLPDYSLVQPMKFARTISPVTPLIRMLG